LTTRDASLHIPADVVPATRDHVLISVNPKAGRRSVTRLVRRLEGLLLERGFRVGIFTDLAEVSTRANQLHLAERLRAVVGVGGDGTAAELVNRTMPGVPVTLLAVGTANLLSKQLRLGGKPEDLVQTIARGQLARLDAGKAGDRLFVVMVSAGFDAEVVERVHVGRQQNTRGGHIGYLSYLKPIVDSIRSYEYPAIRVDIDQIEGDGEQTPLPWTVRWAFALNLPRYGWGLPLAPAARATDGALDLCVFRGGSLWHGLRYALLAQCGGLHRCLSSCHLRRVRRIRMTSSDPIPYQMDGDPCGQLPVEIEVVPGRVTVLVPSRSGFGLGESTQSPEKI
jgi:diacylglycerol kinase family enzyme